MLKFRSNFFENLLYGSSCHKIRTDACWTNVYPSPEPSWLIKRVDTVSDWIYSNIDNFFQGSAHRNIGAAKGNLSLSNNLSLNYVEWELNQDIADIVLNDIKIGFSWILPVFMRKFAIRLHQLTLLYLFTDLVNEDESQEWIELKDKEANHSEPGKIIVMSCLQAIKERIDSKCLSINDWLKKVFSRFRKFQKLERENKTYYLLGYFAPQRYHDPYNDQNYMNNRPDKVKLNPAYSFHKRN